MYLKSSESYRNAKRIPTNLSWEPSMVPKIKYAKFPPDRTKTVGSERFFSKSC